MKRATRCLILLAVASSLLLFTVVPRYDLLDSRAAPHVLQKRQLLPTSGNPPPTTTAQAPTTSAAAPPTTNNPPTTTAQAPTTSAAAPTTNNPPTTTTQQQQTTQQQTTTAPPTTQQQTTAAPISDTSLTTPASVSVGTDSQGQTQTITETSTSATDSASQSATSAASSGDDNSGGGLGTGSIIGLSVAGGVALIGIIGFFVWKFTRKRFADFDDNEAIKWPELNTHGEGSIHHALPTNSTGRSGFGDDGDGLTRAPSGGYANSVAATSTNELYPGGGTDPYAVPPLPHLNPNQAYHDDPSYSQSEFYDPYRGPVPDSMSMDGHSVAQGYGGEAIPMTQMAGRRSPGPGMVYDMGRSSPAPTMGRQSPGPQMMMDDRARSPGPNMGMVPGRLASPAPPQPYGGGYDNGYGGR